MNLYEQPGIRFEVPENWEDRTIVAFAAPSNPDNPVAPNIVLTRGDREGDESLSDYVDRQIVAMAQGLKAFRLLKRSEVKRAHAKCFEIHFVWRSEGGLLRQRQLHTLATNGQVFSLTASVTNDSYAQAEPLFDSIWDSIQLPTPLG